ncbi:MAG: MerR family transcriptional regulator [Actinomycetota bacterium]|nr:MerR family transcriptional regulator [Actinomycetota bacterium]
MPLSRSRDYLSIGEVLEEVRVDFPDVSISKIRFLEAEGLIAPERTGSGYRKFFPQDVARLRYILSLQRDQFLPLKVIRDRLAEAGPNGSYPEVAAGTAPASANGSSSSPGPRPEPEGLASGAQLSRDELKGASGLDEPQLAGLEEYGILARRDTDVYDENDLVAARAAAGLLGFGIEARHLRMFRQFADRETGFYEQIVAPATHRKDRDAHAQAARSVAQLVGLARRLHDALVRANLRDLV